MHTIEERIQMHKNYWEGNPQEKPLVSFRIGDYFLANKFKPNLPLLEKGKIVTADMVNVDDYMDDYERMYKYSESIGQSAFFTAEPCTGFPWIEAMLGCTVVGHEVSFVSEPVFETIEDIEDIELDINNPWYKKYFEFVDKLNELSQGRFPIGQPIIRGVADTVGALIGQEEMAVSILIEPELLKKIFMKISNIHREIIEEHYRRIKPFHGGYTIGFYHLWTPDKSIWNQEDLSLLMSPDNFKKFIVAAFKNTFKGYDYTLTHVHPASFLHLDNMLSIDELKVIQINKDVGGPSIEEMIPKFKKIAEADKRLIVFGDLDEKEIDILKDNIPAQYLFLNIVAPTVERAIELNKYI